MYYKCLCRKSLNNFFTHNLKTTSYDLVKIPVVVSGGGVACGIYYYYYYIVGRNI